MAPGADPAPALRHVRSADGTAIACQHRSRAGGPGPAVVIVEGAGGHRGTSRTLAEALAHRGPVVTWDRRGRGDSGDTPPWSVAREVEDVAAVVGSVDAPVLLYGHSSGAVLALEAVAAGVGVDRLVVYEPPYRLDRPAGSGLVLARAVAALVEAGRRDEAARRFLAEGVGLGQAALERVAASPWWAELVTLAHTLPYDLALCAEPAPPARLAGVTVPTVVAHGERSPAWTAEGCQAVARLVPGARTVVVPGAGHALPDDAARLLLAGSGTEG